MNYQVFARKFRPQLFKEVIGQEAVVTTLLHALQQGRVAQAYLFCGCRGTGKTTLARLFAKALNCSALTEAAEPCNACSSCLEIAASRSLDVIEIDGASHRGIEDVRQINDAVQFAPTLGKYKIYLIDEVHMLTKEAFNALLKTLEEPPLHVKFFFATTEVHKVPATILSRCQRFQLHRLTEEQIVASLEGIAKTLTVDFVEREGLEQIALLAEGSLRDAQSLFDQVVSFCDKRVSLEAVRTALGLPDRAFLERLDQSKGHYEVAFEIAQELFASGKQTGYVLEALAHHFRAHLLSKRGLGTSPGAEGYREQQLLDLIDEIQEAMVGIKQASSERVYIEMVLLRIIRSHERFSPIELFQRLEALEQRYQGTQVDGGSMPTDKASPPRTSESSKPVQEVLKQNNATKGVEISMTKVVSGDKLHPVLLTARDQGRVETLMRFAAKELNGSLNTQPKK